MTKINKFKQIKSELINIFPEKSDIEIEKLVEHTMCTNTLHELIEVEKWYEDVVIKLKTKVEIVDINDCENWETDENGNIQHSTNKFFKIIGVKVSNSSSREVGNKGWSQPIIAETTEDGGLLGLVRSNINGLPHYLVEAKFEPGNVNFVQLSPTLQATFSNINRAHGGVQPKYLDIFNDYENNEEDYIFKQWFSEDGGRLFNKRNLGLVKNVNYEDISEIQENFYWISLYQIRQFLSKGPYVNPHLARLIFMYQ